MKKNKIFILAILLSLFIPSIIYADCKEEDIEAFKEIEDKYEVTYEFNAETKLYTVLLNNPGIGKFAYSGELFNLKYKVSLSEDKKIKVEDVPPGNYDIEIISEDDYCEKIFKKIELKLPKYNKYYNDPLCNGIEEFVLCQPTYDKDIDRDTFVERVNAYKKSKEKKEIEEKEKNKNIEEPKEESKIVKYIKDNLIKIIIITAFAIIVLVTIILTAKSYKKSRRLE